MISHSIPYLVLMLLTSASIFGYEGIVGFWKTINEHTEKPESVIAIYDYQGKFYGRIILTFDENGSVEDSIVNPKNKAPGVKGAPYYSGLDIIWGLEPENNKFTNGQILDPEKGRVYDAKLWRENNNLIVRGELLIFGRNQTWLPVEKNEFPLNFPIPDLSSMTPRIPEVIDRD